MLSIGHYQTGGSMPPINLNTVSRMEIELLESQDRFRQAANELNARIRQLEIIIPQSDCRAFHRKVSDTCSATVRMIPQVITWLIPIIKCLNEPTS